MTSPRPRWVRAQLSLLCVGVLQRWGTGQVLQWGWDWLKWEVCYIGGGCAHSGLCCEHLSLRSDGQPIVTHAQWQRALGQRPDWSRFVPMGVTPSSGRWCFRCVWRQGGRCMDYAHRPRVCREYPYSVFFQSDGLHVGCGYHMLIRSFRWLWVPPSIARHSRWVEWMRWGETQWVG